MKPYQKPRIITCQVQPNHMIASSNPNSVDLPFTDISSNDGSGAPRSADGISRRGTWGDLWSDAE